MFLEGAVIVGSILLAFGIEAWWDGRQDEAAAEELAGLLLADIEADIAEMESRNARADTILARIGELAILSQPGVALPGADSLRILTGSTWSASTFTPSLSSFDVVTGGAWDRIPQDSRVLLSQYVQGFMTYNVDADLIAMEALFSLAGDHGGLYALVGLVGAEPTSQPWEPDRDRLSRFVRDPHVQTWISLRHAMVFSQWEWRAEWIGKLAEVAEELGRLAESR